MNLTSIPLPPPSPPNLHIHIQPIGVIDPDEELAHLLAEGHQLMLSQDEELARQLQEEENQMAKQRMGDEH